MFMPSELLLKYLNAQPHDIYDIVGALIGYINADPYFETNDFDAAVEYVLHHGVSEYELFSPFDSGLDYVEDESRWDEDYYSYARVYLKDNFCRERISHVKKVAEKIHTHVKHVIQVPQQQVSSTPEQHKTEPEAKRPSSTGGTANRPKQQGHRNPREPQTIRRPAASRNAGIGLIVAVIVLVAAIVYITKK